MKKIILILSALSCIISGYSQEFKDLIVTNANDSIHCTITLFNDNNFFYDHKTKRGIVNDMLPVNKVKYYSMSENKSVPLILYKKDTTIQTEKLSESINVNLRNSSTLFGVAGGCFVLGSLATIINATAKVPYFDANNINSNAIVKYNIEIDKYNTKQKQFKIISAGCYGLGGLFIVIAGGQLMGNKKKENKTVQVKPTPMGVALVYYLK